MDESQIINWLLESEIPTIRYKTMLDLLQYSPQDKNCRKTYQEIQSGGPVPAILDRQVESGRWQHAKHYYGPKFTSTHWSMMLLEELLCSPEEQRFQAAVEFMLSATQKLIMEYSDTQNTGFTCLFGNIIRYSVYGGRLGDHHLQTMIDLTANSLFQEQCKCDWNWQMPCVWGAARSIWGLISIPEVDRSDQVENAIHDGMNFVLKNVNLIIQNQSSEVEKQTHKTWSKLNFPLFYQADILFVLRLLSEMNELNHPLAGNLIEWLQSRQKPNGQWQGTSPYRQRTHPEMGKPEETSRWVTLQATSILRKV